jgi:hypothetical protein
MLLDMQKPALWGENEKREAVPITSDEKRTLPDARGTASRRPKGQ